MADTITLKVNGDDIDLNAFVRKALAGVIDGFLAALRDVPAPAERIEITIKRAAGSATTDAG